jgi:hypothetical protein
MSYQLKVSRRSLKAARLISRLQSAFQKALVESGKTQQQVALELGVDRSVVNRRLKSSANLTARSMSDFAYVLGKDIEIKLIDPHTPKGSNWVVTAGSRKTHNIQSVGGDAAGVAAPVSVEIESAEA